MAHSKSQQAPLNPMPQVGPVPHSAMPQVATVALGPEPTTVTCPSCGAAVTTSVRMQPTTQTHLMALLLCCICILCTCIPYLVDSCQSADHYCPNCDAYLGSYKR